jgi:hypothetical protein
MRETFAIKVLTTDSSNILIAGKLGMRMRYSNTGPGARPGLRGCTQELRAADCSKPSSPDRPPARCRDGRVSPCVRGASIRSVRAIWPSGKFAGRRTGRADAAAQCRHSLGTAARPAGGRAKAGATESLGSRRRLGGGTSVSEGSDAVGSVKGVHALGGNHSGDHFGMCLGSVAPERIIVPHLGSPGSFVRGAGLHPR